MLHISLGLNGNTFTKQLPKLRAEKIVRLLLDVVPRADSAFYPYLYPLAEADDYL